MIALPPFPLRNFNLEEGRVGAGHEVRGQIFQADGCPGPLTNAEIYLTVWYLFPSGDNWIFPQRTFTADNYYAGYDELVIGTNLHLVQGYAIAKTKLDAKGSFVLQWKEVVNPDRTPYFKAHHIIKSNFDASDTTGYGEIIIKRVYRAGGSHKVTTPNQIPDWRINFAPTVLLEFFGTEVQKQLPPLTAQCIPIIGG